MAVNITVNFGIYGSRFRVELRILTVVVIARFSLEFMVPVVVGHIVGGIGGVHVQVSHMAGTLLLLVPSVCRRWTRAGSCMPICLGERWSHKSWIGRDIPVRWHLAIGDAITVEWDMTVGGQITVGR